MHRLIYVAVPTETVKEGETAIEDYVQEAMTDFNEGLNYESGDWESDTALFELITPDHPEARGHLEPELLMENPYAALCEAFVSMEEERFDSVTDTRYRSSTTGIAIFDAREYVTVGRNGSLSTDKIQPDYGLMREVREKGLRKDVNFDREFIYTKAASMPKYVLKALKTANIDEICFLDVHGEMAIGRSILNKGKFDWFEVGGRWKKWFKNAKGEYVTSILSMDAERARTENWNEELLPKFFEVAEEFYNELLQLEGWEDTVDKLTDPSVELNRKDFEPFYEFSEDWVRKYIPTRINYDIYEDYDEKMGVDIQYSLWLLVREHFSFWKFVDGLTGFRDLMYFKLNVPTALLFEGKWHEYDAYYCNEKWHDVEAAVDRAKRFREDIKKVVWGYHIVAVDIHS